MRQEGRQGSSAFGEFAGQSVQENGVQRPALGGGIFAGGGDNRCRHSHNHRGGRFVRARGSSGSALDGRGRGGAGERGAGRFSLSASGIRAESFG